MKQAFNEFDQFEKSASQNRKTEKSLHEDSVSYYQLKPNTISETPLDAYS